MWAIAAAIHNVAYNHPRVRRLAIFSDSLNSVQIFNTLRAKREYNAILKLVVNILLETKLEIRVSHIPGVQNTEADLLSRYELVQFGTQFPHITTHYYEPPPAELEAMLQ